MSRKRISPEDIEKLTGISAKSIRRWKAGEGVPSVEDCRKLAQVKLFKVPVARLLSLRQKAFQQRQEEKEKRKGSKEKRGKKPGLAAAVTELKEFTNADEAELPNLSQTSTPQNNAVLQDENEVAEEYLRIMLQLAKPEAKDSLVLLTALAENSMFNSDQIKLWRSALRAAVKNGV